MPGLRWDACGITNQRDITAIVNAANAWFKPDGGIAGAIHRFSWIKLAEECLRLVPIKPGKAVITKGYKLPNRLKEVIPHLRFVEKIRFVLYTKEDRGVYQRVLSLYSSTTKENH